MERTLDSVGRQIRFAQIYLGTYLSNLHISGTYLSYSRSDIWVPRYISRGYIQSQTRIMFGAGVGCGVRARHGID